MSQEEAEPPAELPAKKPRKAAAPRQPREYRPNRGSAPYAMLVELYFRTRAAKDEFAGMYKEEIAEKASRWCPDVEIIG